MQMENNLEYIDAYFSGTLTSEKRKQFEQKIAEDKNFAGEVAFYLAAKQTLQEEVIKEKKERFKLLASQDPSQSKIQQISPRRRVMIYRLAAAAAVVGIVFLSWYLFFQTHPSPNQMANEYVKENFHTLPVKMSTAKDSLQEGLRLYNAGQLNAALQQFEAILQRDSADFTAKTYAGIVYLGLNNYDKALLYFRQLEKHTFRSNLAMFYQALTLMKRNAPGDKQEAQQLLQQFAKSSPEGKEKEIAQQWLKKW